MKILRSLFWEYLIVIIVLFLADASVWLFIWGNSLQLGSASSFLINLSAGFVSSIVIIFGIETLRKKREDFRLEKGKVITRDAVANLGDISLVYVANLLHFGLDQYIDSTKTLAAMTQDELDQVFHRAKQDMLEGILNADLKTRLETMSVDEWKMLQSYISTILNEIREIIFLYRYMVEPEVYGNILALRNSLTKFLSTFSIFPDFFIKPKEEWPKEYPDIRSQLISNFNFEIKKYFSDVKDFRAALK